MWLTQHKSSHELPGVNKGDYNAECLKASKRDQEAEK